MADPIVFIRSSHGLSTSTEFNVKPCDDQPSVLQIVMRKRKDRVSPPHSSPGVLRVSSDYRTSKFVLIAYISKYVLKCSILVVDLLLEVDIPVRSMYRHHSNAVSDVAAHALSAFM
jgi:hypothetical protein